ncbi:MAG: universal stress protein [Paracoccaceae bacterium]|nr:universal stress protein [Paracoccaceae bacterium]
MQNIMVASDLSERSRPAIQRAVQLASDLQARLTVVHVVDAAMPEPLAAKVQDKATALLQSEVSQGGGKVEADIQVLVGDTVEAIADLVRDTGADLLIVGQHRRRVFLDQVKETTMEHLVRASDVPVLLVANLPKSAYAQVLGGIDFSAFCASALHKVQTIAPDAELTVFHAHDVSFRKEAERDFEIWQATTDAPKDLPIPVFLEARAKDAVEDLLAEKPYDLLVIGAHTRSNAARFVLGGFSAGLIRNPPCDLLLAR